MFDFSYGPIDFGPNFIEGLQDFAKQQEKLKLMEKYQRPEGSAEYNFSGDLDQTAKDMANLGFVDNNPMTMEAMTSKYSGFLDDLYGVPEIGGSIYGGSIYGGSIPGVDNRVDFLGRVTEPSYVDPMPTPDYIQGGPAILPKEPEPIARPGIEALMPAEEEGYKKYIASDTNPFESMGISSLGQDALKQMIFERNNPQANQSRGYKSYIG